MSIIKYIFATVLAVLMVGCPSAMVETVENFERQIDSLNSQKRRKYNVGRAKYEEIKKKIAENDSLSRYINSLDKKGFEETKQNLISSLSSRQAQKSINNLPINAQIKSVDLKGYPDSVSLYVSLTNIDGVNITGLGSPYLSKDSINYYWKFLAEDCITDNVEYENFNVEEIRFDSSPKTGVNYLLDYSGSMPDKIVKSLRAGIKKMIYHTKKNDEIGLTLMSTEYNKEIQLTSDLEDAKAILAADSAKIKRSGNKVKEPFFSIIKDLKKSDAEKKIIVMFSDGLFDRSEVDSVISEAIRNDVTIYTVTYLMQMNDAKILGDLSEKTGGTSYFIISPKEIPYVFAEIYLGLNNYYKITYKPAKCSGIHDVGLVLNLDDLGMPLITAQTDYIIPIFDKPEVEQENINLDINFATGSAKIDESSKKILDAIIPKLKAYSEVDILIVGHTDDIGSEDDNLKLSKQRAESIKQYLVKNKVRKERIKTLGKGESEHLVANDSQENRRKNRRTEIKLNRN